MSQPPDNPIPPKDKRDLVRFDVNMDAPIWAPSAYARESKRTYRLPWKGDSSIVEVLAVAEFGQLRTVDKKVLAVLINLWHKKGRSPDGKVFFQISEIVEAIYGEGSTKSGKRYELVKKSLFRLQGTAIHFKSSFKNPDTRQYEITHAMNILAELTVVEPKKDGKSTDLLGGISYTVLDFSVVRDLLGNYTRPLSLRLLKQLSERGVLFESYVNAVLSRNKEVKTDIFKMWEERGLSTAWAKYGSQLKAKMLDDLDAMMADPDHPLAYYSFEKQADRRSRSLNVVLGRKAEPREIQTTRGKGRSREDLTRLVDRIRMELRDLDSDGRNYEYIAANCPENEIVDTCLEAWAKYRDEKVKSAPAFFIWSMMNKARLRGEPFPWDKQTELHFEKVSPAEKYKLSKEKEKEYREQYELFLGVQIQRYLKNPAMRDQAAEATGAAHAKTLNQVDENSAEFDEKFRANLQVIICRKAGIPSFENWLDQVLA
jgi:hypothetical protein